jgi:hypothetical protein
VQGRDEERAFTGPNKELAVKGRKEEAWRGVQRAAAQPNLTDVHKGVYHKQMAVSEQPPSFPVHSDFSMSGEVQAEIAVNQELPIELKMDFGWNENKRLKNLKDRGVDFRDAAQIFEGLLSPMKTRGRITASNDSAPLVTSMMNITWSPIHGEDQFYGSLAHGR